MGRRYIITNGKVYYHTDNENKAKEFCERNKDYVYYEVEEIGGKKDE